MVLVMVRMCGLRLSRAKDLVGNKVIITIKVKELIGAMDKGA